MRWTFELAYFKFDIAFCPGKGNIIADTLSKITASITLGMSLGDMHADLCHRYYKNVPLIRSENLPFSLEDIKKIINSCPICMELKPRLLKNEGKLIKATFPFEIPDLDFKGPLLTNSHYSYLLTIINEFSRFPCP
ncbi:RNA-directed DNA polymerase [Caerostris darwini]|uniref:RNA-directed DNA polymerase n=1 Tax=Caerostris darwini TaxID=1538125 RepID=A0AAV4UD15_9ARAC|nr:RNA-directed DNA polymerase [Caerostris darwini]